MCPRSQPHRTQQGLGYQKARAAGSCVSLRGHYGSENFQSALDKSLTKAEASLLYNLDYSMSCLHLEMFLSFVLSSPTFY